MKTRPEYDTAGSVKLLKASGRQTTAAVASKQAALIYDMAILQTGIEDNPANFTRFLEIRPEPISPEGEVKTSIVFTLDNVPGALFRALSTLALRDIDLTKIESRPLAGKPWEYLFYVDFLGAVDDETVKRSLAHLEEYAEMLRVLGSYPRSAMPLIDE